MPSQKQLTWDANILLVEDNPADQMLTLEGLKQTHWVGSSYVVGDGEEALAYLQGLGKYADAPKPELIILDLNLPRKDGREVLRTIKVDPRYRRIPVIVLTTSDAEEDILNCYDSHANCYITKPVGVDAFFEAISAIEHFWLELVKLPALASSTRRRIQRHQGTEP